ncbi:MAG: PPOX class F420-dependent oxidoreductase [Pseudomonadales bacterium]
MSLNNAQYISFGTFKRDGSCIETPVWFAPDEHHYYVFSAADAGKVKRLRNSGKSRIAPCTVTGKVTGEWQDCEAWLINDSEDVKHAYKALHKKYGWKMFWTDIMSKMSGRYNQRQLIGITPK